MKLEALGQPVENGQDWLAPRMAGKASATTQAPVVSVRDRPAGAAAMNLVSGVARGDGGEPGAQADVLVQ